MRVISLALAAVAVASQAYGAGAPREPARAPKIGVEVNAAGVSQHDELQRAIQTQLAARSGAVEATAVVSEGCENVTFCISVIATPVRIGRRQGGLAVASYVSRRLTDHPQWPWTPPPPATEPSSPVTIQNAFTVGGKAGCAPCERALEDLRDEIGTVNAITRDTMVDEGDLNLSVGPADAAFIGEVASDLAARFVEKHLEPWLDQKKTPPS